MAVKHVVRTDQAPAPFQGAPYSQGIIFSDLVWVSGQVAIDPGSGNVVEGGIAEQTEQVMQNVSAILEEAGSGLKQLVKTTIFLADLQDFGNVNEVYARYFPSQPPARATVQAAGLPRGALVEIDAIAAVGG